MVTRQCNLNCPHCDIKEDICDPYDEKAFLKNLETFDGIKIVFGGEPTIVPERTLKALPYCNSISTNLLNIRDDVLRLISRDGISVATSWNPARFSEEQLMRWQNNVKRLRGKAPDSHITCLITLTPDLICKSGEEHFFRQVIPVANNFDGIIFEQLFDREKTQGFYDSVDEWLVGLYDKVSAVDGLCKKFPQFTQDYKWYFDCSETFTMLPNGKIRQGCPQFDHVSVPHKCYSCEDAAICRPCRLQACCTRPTRLMNHIRNK